MISADGHALTLDPGSNLVKPRVKLLSGRKEKGSIGQCTSLEGCDCASAPGRWLHSDIAILLVNRIISSVAVLADYAEGLESMDKNSGYQYLR